MKTKDGFIHAHNAQAAVDATSPVIVAHGLDAKHSDQHQLAPIADAIEATSSRSPRGCRRTPAIAPTPTLRRWSDARSTPLSRRGGPSTLRKEKAAARRRRRRAHRRPARENQRRRPRKPLSPEEATARAGVRPDQAGARLAPVPDARRRESRRRSGPRPPRPQPPEARSGMNAARASRSQITQTDPQRAAPSPKLPSRASQSAPPQR